MVWVITILITVSSEVFIGIRPLVIHLQNLILRVYFLGANFYP